MGWCPNRIFRTIKTDYARKTEAAVEAHFQFLMWLVRAIEKFPRTQKFLLGDRIQTTALAFRTRYPPSVSNGKPKAENVLPAVVVDPNLMMCGSVNAWGMRGSYFYQSFEQEQRRGPGAS